MSDSTLNPLGNLYDSFIEVLQNVTIKYSYLADKYETLETEQAADAYMDAVLERDSFTSYQYYTPQELVNVGITDSDLISDIVAGNVNLIEPKYYDLLVKERRKNVIESFEEKNNYYRMLNGYPDIEVTPLQYLYLDRIVDEDGNLNETLTAEGIKIKNSLGVDIKVPIHRIQDYYNKMEPELGDNIINRIESAGFIKSLIAEYPNRNYLRYIGQNRISITTARRAKNFQILQLKQKNIKNTFYNQFTTIYEQCRLYFISTIYIPIFKEFIEEYNHFIAMAIMVMAIQHTVASQMKLGIRREFFDIYAVRLLYQVYNIPYNLYLDEQTQQRIVQGLNGFIQDKATNKVLYDVAAALGFGDNFSIYKYYLSKQHKYDQYGVPIFLEKERFNDITGEMEKIPDYEQMYDVYFHRDELRNTKFAKSFTETSNDLEYESVVNGDSYWWKDSNVYDRVWKTEYNFVESKYLGTTISYRMTDLMFENILLFKMIIDKNEELKNLRITLPKITGEEQIPIMDVFILMICLTACKHHLTGEVITLPTDVLSVMDYTQKMEKGLNTNPHLVAFSNMIEEGSIDTVNAFAFDFEYLLSKEAEEEVNSLKHRIGDDAFFQLKHLLSVLSINSLATDEEKIDAINHIYSNIKELYLFLNYHMSKTTDRKTYKQLKNLYMAAFYSHEMYETFKVNTGTSVRPAFNYFEYLYYKNPVLYDAVFDYNPIEQYYDYLKQLEEESEEEIHYTYEDYLRDVDTGKLTIQFDVLRDGVIDDKDIRDEKIYFYMNHIISRLQIILDNLNFVNLIGDSSTPVEELLIKLIRFFKSHTVELINTETIYLCDLKMENMVRFFDEIHEANKTNLMKEHLYFPFADTVDLFAYIVENGGSVKLIDRIIYEVWVWLDENSMHLNETIELDKTKYGLQSLTLFDAFHALATEIRLHDHKLITDKVPGEYYDELLYDVWAWLDEKEFGLIDKLEIIKELLTKDQSVLYDVFHSMTTNIDSKDYLAMHDKVPRSFRDDMVYHTWAHMKDGPIGLHDTLGIHTDLYTKVVQRLLDVPTVNVELSHNDTIHWREAVAQYWTDD